MSKTIDIQKIRYLVNVLGLTIRESLQIDMNLASEYGLMPGIAVVRLDLLKGRRAEVRGRDDRGEVA
jgi:hypothetical protein